MLLKLYLFQKETQKYLSLTIVLIAFLLLLPIKSFSQTNKHMFFGIDLDSDWRSLTNQQYLRYWLEVLSWPLALLRRNIDRIIAICFMVYFCIV